MQPLSSIKQNNFLPLTAQSLLLLPEAEGKAVKGNSVSLALGNMIGAVKVLNSIFVRTILRTVLSY
jgi:hypothetical protein